MNTAEKLDHRSDEVIDQLKVLDYETVHGILDAADKAQQAKWKAGSKKRALGVRIFGERKSQAVPVEVLTKGMNRKEIIARMAVDFNFFSMFLLPVVMKYRWPSLMVAVWNILADCVADLQDSVGDANLALAIPRGFAKTTFMKLYIVYCILFTRHTFILIVCSVDSNAENILKDVIGILDSSQVRTIFGNWDTEKFNDRQDFKHFKFMGKDIILKAKGANTSLRGLNVGNRRPDIILMDDIQTEENAKSPVESQSLKTWIMSTLLPTVSPEGGINLFIGNSYSYEGAILPLLVKSDTWLTLTLGCILSDGSSLWPELHPIDKLLAHYRRDLSMGVEALWLAQYMNAMDINPANLIDLARVGAMFRNRWPDAADSAQKCSEFAQAKYLVIDPSSSKVNADDTAIGLFYLIDGTPVFRKVKASIFTPKDTILKAMAIALQENAPVIFVEDVAYQATFLFWANYFTEKLKLEKILRWVPISPERTSKNSRILNMFAQCSNGELMIHPDAWAQFKSEAVSFDKLKTNNRDNILDVAHYGPIIAVTHRRMLEDAYHESYYRALAVRSKSARLLLSAEKLPC